MATLTAQKTLTAQYMKDFAPVKVQMATRASAQPVAQTKGVKTHGLLWVEKNNYAAKVSALANSGATIIGVTVNQDTRNSWDIHYYTVA
jgi:hypothetical protein